MLIESVMPTGFGRQLLNVQAAKLGQIRIPQDVFRVSLNRNYGFHLIPITDFIRHYWRLNYISLPLICIFFGE